MNNDTVVTSTEIKLNYPDETYKKIKEEQIVKVNDLDIILQLDYFKHYQLDFNSIPEVLSRDFNKLYVLFIDPITKERIPILKVNIGGFPAFCFSANIYNIRPEINSLNFEKIYNSVFKKQLTKVIFEFLGYHLFYRADSILYYKRRTAIISTNEKGTFEKMFDFSVLNHKKIPLGNNPNSNNDVSLHVIYF